MTATNNPHHDTPAFGRPGQPDFAHAAPATERASTIGAGPQATAHTAHDNRASSRVTRNLSDPNTTIRPFDAAAIAAHLRSISGTGDKPDLYAIARALQVRSISVDPKLDRLGHTSWTASLPDIRLQDGQSLARRRFTLAHELTHVLLRHGDTTDAQPSNGPVRPNFRREEWQADAVAGCLLVPDYAVTALRDLRLNDTAREATLAAVRDTAETFQVSNSVVVRRLADYDRARHWLLVNLKRGPQGEWLTWRMIGRVRGRYDPRMQVLDSSFRDLDRLPELDVTVQFRARLGVEDFEMSGVGNRQRDLVFVLIDTVRRLEL